MIPVCAVQCGTVVPVWMNGTHPSVADGMVSRQVCANFGTNAGTGSTCCSHSLQIGVKNCADFYVYYLKATPTCPVSYCAGTCCCHGCVVLLMVVLLSRLCCSWWCCRWLCCSWWWCCRWLCCSWWCRRWLCCSWWWCCWLCCSWS